MGLESHVDRIIDEERPSLRSLYYWSHGLNVANEKVAREIIFVLDASDQFGPARYNKKTGKIEFGNHRTFFRNPMEWQYYREDFKSFRIKE
jgi:hypothetical protein